MPKMLYPYEHYQDRIEGAVLGSFVGDALSLGVHWIYENEALTDRYGRITDFRSPGIDSYHPSKRSGDQSHVGDQALRLMRFLYRTSEWDYREFKKDWVSMWATYGDYRDRATRRTLSNFEEGDDSGAISEEMAGVARIAPLVAFFARSDEEMIGVACQQQTEMTHRSRLSYEAAEFLGRLTYRLMMGGELDALLEKIAPKWVMERVDEIVESGNVDGIGKFGRSCSIPAALPGVMFLARKYADDPETALIENTMAGGDNCTRGMVLGMLLGAMKGREKIPKRWVESLRAKEEVDRFLSSLSDPE